MNDVSVPDRSSAPASEWDCRDGGMKLALVISSLSSGGAERVMSQLANYWAERGEMVTLITLDTCASDSYPLDSRVRRVPLGMMGDSGAAIFTALANNYRRIVALRRAVIAAGATVVLSFEDRTSILVRLATAWLPLRHVISERVDPREYSNGRTWNFLRRITYPLADALVVQTRGLVPWAKSVMLGRQRVEVIPNPARDMQAFVQTTADRSRHAVVATGRLVRQKGFDVLLTAFARIAGDFTSWKLVILGEGPERVSLVRLADTLGIGERVELPGWHPEPGETLATASLFVMSSRFEGFPNALIEAMACGLPVISTRWAGAVEIITDGFDGLLVPIDSVAELAVAMRRLIADRELRVRFGTNALAVSERYKLSPVIQKWDAVLAAPCKRLRAIKSYS